MTLWLPSQRGLVAERPQRHRATGPLRYTSTPSMSHSAKSPRTISGPSGYGVTVVVGRAA